jgi:uncharacterized protein (DUF2252 family)
MNDKTFSGKQSADYGRAQRKHLSRSELDNFDPASRHFDAVKVIAESCQGRVPKLIPIKFQRMSLSLFAFFRGTVEVMAADLASAKNTRIEVQLAGDAHVNNFGFFASPDAQVIFDMNDFDETFRGPWEWDVKRMTTSIMLAGREAGNSNAVCKEAVDAFLSTYFLWIRRFTQMLTIDVARHRVKRNLTDSTLAKSLKQAVRATPLENLHKLARKTARGWRFRSKPSLLWDVPGQTRSTVLSALPLYRNTLRSEYQHLFDRFHPVDVGFKVVGTGSVGTRDYVVLMFGRDENDPLILQIKEEPPAIYSRYLKHPTPRNEGQRVVEGQRALQVFSDMLLGWCSMEGRDYLVRQLNDHKAGCEISDLRGPRLGAYSRLCAELMAKGHARSGDPVAIFAYVGSGQKAAQSLRRFAVQYADQVEADYAAFRKALKSGALSKLLHASH